MIGLREKFIMTSENHTLTHYDLRGKQRAGHGGMIQTRKNGKTCKPGTAARRQLVRQRTQGGGWEEGVKSEKQASTERDERAHCE